MSPTFALHYVHLSLRKSCKPKANLTPICQKLSLLPPSPGFLDLDAAAQLLQHEFPRVVVDDEHAVLLVRPLVSFEYRHRRRGALEGQKHIHFPGL